MEIINRIKELVVEKFGERGETSFAKTIGVNQVTFNKYIRGRVPSLETIDAILRTFPEISAEWLLRGNGEMIISDASSMKDIEPTYSQTSAMYESLLKDRDEQIEELKAEKNQLIGENNIMREQLGIRTREKSA